MKTIKKFSGLKDKNTITVMKNGKEIERPVDYIEVKRIFDNEQDPEIDKPLAVIKRGIPKINPNKETLLETQEGNFIIMEI